MNLPLFSWMHPALEIRETGRYGNGVFATRSLAKDEILIVMGGYILTIVDENRLTGVVADKPIEISDRFSIGPRTPEDLHRMPQHYVNHSCDPNAGFKGQLFLVAMRAISPGEEIAYDYAMVMHPSPKSAAIFSMQCHCGSSQCRGRVTEDDWRKPELQARYDGYFQWFLQDKIERLRNRENYCEQSISWLHPALEIRRTRGGRGIYARESIPAGRKLAVCGGYVMRITDEPSLANFGADFALQIDEEFVIGAYGETDMDDAQYFNHSCNPNAGLCGQIGLVAMRDIGAGEEVTFDYAMVIADAPGIPPYAFECRCGSVLCRGTVTDRDWRLPELQSRYAGYFSWHVAGLIGRHYP
ncbi:MAG: SET domain-containing protein-lysine N-methyltransferase [Rhodocyclaceae bacterium]|nr:SET domain-containing protein-lysine N-methyltransferase [Rhodocyclaceae bacterium]